MPRVVTSYRILPTGVEVSMENLKEAIKRVLPPSVQVYKFEEEPIAFGLKALNAHIIMPGDVDGLVDKVEEALKNVDGVSQVDALMVRQI